ncbi:MBL fold metallo-hydrolase [Pseudoponticoccus marisrubri]|uniref:MBL fold metallo-hydrolase n=1 Tax=Pseudoponticoccus marisrubri TaxID=1685382 RepID=A0A0W7WJD8_9RHOB|nr:MBL fold metallo-hydrolase [Pseudoponticoccus marisrubri]KUF10736.1 MBL fold metallo-hydrolase [Pseudoponticoccus marisrubri]
MRLDHAEGFPEAGTPALYWLGQAGFWIDTGTHRLLIDPYLSDSLARKYAGTAHPHLRMMPPPVTMEALPRPDLVLVTHAHTDHMDPDTLGPLHRRFPDLPFVVPAAVEDVARQRIGADAPLRKVVAGETVSPLPGLDLTVFPAAHETRERDDQGRDRFLGYGLTTGALRLYHSGDSVPFDALDAQVQAFAPQIALLPVNGRDPARRAAGIPGNFTLDEALHLARECAFLVPHHFDMFAFNTIDPARIDSAAARSRRPRIIRPAAGGHLRIGP